MLWPAMRKALADDSYRVALLDALGEEHFAIDPLLAGPSFISGFAVTTPAREPLRLPRYCRR